MWLWLHVFVWRLFLGVTSILLLLLRYLPAVTVSHIFNTIYRQFRNCLQMICRASFIHTFSMPRIIWRYRKYLSFSSRSCGDTQVIRCHRIPSKHILLLNIFLLIILLKILIKFWITFYLVDIALFLLILALQSRFLVIKVYWLDKLLVFDRDSLYTEDFFQAF